MPTSLFDDEDISLVPEDGEISNINIYSGSAEVTRTFKILVKEGKGVIGIHALPTSLVCDSLRVEIEGCTTIDDVVLSSDDVVIGRHFETHIHQLKRRRKELESEIWAEKHARSVLCTYLATVKAEHADLSTLKHIFDEHRRLSKEMDCRIFSLEEEQALVDKMLTDARKDPKVDNAKHLSQKLSVKITATRKEEVELSLKYRVMGADWTPFYEVRADTQRSDMPLSLRYKAKVTQATYEDWNEAPMTLHTETHNFDTFHEPTIRSRKLWASNQHDTGPVPAFIPPSPTPEFEDCESLSSGSPRISWRPVPGSARDPSGPVMARGPNTIGPPQFFGPPPSLAGIRISNVVDTESDDSCEDPLCYQCSQAANNYRPVMRHSQVPSTASYKGGVMATFQVPGRVNLPSDKRKHAIAVARLKLDADICWYTIPSRDSRVYIKAKIKSCSEYLIIPGQVKTYVDDSFASTGTMPLVSPQETFDLLFGVDSGIKVDYLPQERETTEAGLDNKTLSHIVTQRITIHNMRSTPVKNLKVTDVIPVSKDECIEVRLISPALTIPSTSNGSTEKSGDQSVLELQGKSSVNDSVEVAPNVRAQWSGLGEPDVDQEALGKDSMVSWLVSLEAQERVTLVLQYEVDHPEGLVVEGM